MKCKIKLHNIVESQGHNNQRKAEIIDVDQVNFDHGKKSSDEYCSVIMAHAPNKTTPM